MEFLDLNSVSALLLCAAPARSVQSQQLCATKLKYDLILSQFNSSLPVFRPFRMMIIGVKIVMFETSVQFPSAISIFLAGKLANINPNSPIICTAASRPFSCNTVYMNIMCMLLNQYENDHSVCSVTVAMQTWLIPGGEATVALPLGMSQKRESNRWQ